MAWKGGVQVQGLLVRVGAATTVHHMMTPGLPWEVPSCVPATNHHIFHGLNNSRVSKVCCCTLDAWGSRHHTSCHHCPPVPPAPC
jgi:hypothetical protein